MQNGIMHLELDAAHFFFCERTLQCDALETADARVFDFVELLNGFGRIDQKVGSFSQGSEAPYFSGFVHIHEEIFLQQSCSGLRLLGRCDQVVFDSIRETVGKWHRVHEEPVVLVGRLAQHLPRLDCDSLPVGHHRISSDDFGAS